MQVCLRTLLTSLTLRVRNSSSDRVIKLEIATSVSGMHFFTDSRNLIISSAQRSEFSRLFRQFVPTWRETFPIAISLLASYLSAIALLGVPSEIFTYGAQYTVLLFSYFILTATAAIVFVPIFHGLHLTSAHEYLELRFGHGVRILGCFLFVIQYFLYLSVVLYAPSLALQAVAGVPLAASIISTGVVCTFYTTLGGLKAVVWTDVFQAMVMVAGLITVFIVGTVNVGGFDKVWQINKDRGRLTFFDFNPDPTVRNTFWTLAIGGAFTAMPPWTVSQAAVQRFLASKSVETAQ
ncbi:sodium-coupled monocarboxylate transporter 1-like, partial [Paramuricea clavata]